MHALSAHVQSYIAEALPPARAVKTKWGVPVSVVLAQGALESGWGREVRGNAWFGVKGRSLAGASVRSRTHEFVKGRSKATAGVFRAYANLADAADAYGRMLRSDPRFAGCFAFSDDPDQFVVAMARANYATDPRYGKKLQDIIHRYGLERYDKKDPAA